MSYIKVEGHTSLVRDVKTNAIVNNNKNEFQLYMKRRSERNQQSDTMRKTVKEINNLKSELREINSLLTKVLSK